jgi:hypothetical protein
LKVSIASVNDWQKLALPNAKDSVGDWRRFERPSSLQRVVAEERELESRRSSAYAKYVELVENEQRRMPPRYKISPLSYSEWSKHIPAGVTDISLASQIATNAALLSKTRSDEAAQAEAESKESREAVIAGKPDPAWKIPETAVGLSMSVEAAKSFVKAQADAFLEAMPSYHRCQQNWDRMRSYIETQGIEIPNLEVFTQAFERLSALGLLELRPVLAPETIPEPVPESSGVVPAETEFLDGVDPETGEPRRYTQREVWQMDSTTYRKAFKAWGENRPAFTRGYYGQR